MHIRNKQPANERTSPISVGSRAPKLVRVSAAARGEAGEGSVASRLALQSSFAAEFVAIVVVGYAHRLLIGIARANAYPVSSKPNRASSSVSDLDSKMQRDHFRARIRNESARARKYPLAARPLVGCRWARSAGPHSSRQLRQSPRSELMQTEADHRSVT